MTDLNLTEILLAGVLSYGAPALGLALLFGALGLPLPGTLLLLAAGAFARQGVLDGLLAAGLALLGVVLGDSLSYALGHFAQGWVARRFGRWPAWRKAEGVFTRRAGGAVYLTRFLITSLAIPTNLIAGASGYAFGRFLLFDAAGEATWVAIFGGLGYLFGSQWELVSQFVGDYSGLLVGVLVLGVGAYLLIRRLRAG
jgi:membrane-associated protein